MSDTLNPTTSWHDYFCDLLNSLSDEERIDFDRLTAHFAAENQRITAEIDRKAQEQGR